MSRLCRTLTNKQTNKQANSFFYFQELVINDCAKTEKLRTKLTKELNDLDIITKNKTLLDSIFNWFYKIETIKV